MDMLFVLKSLIKNAETYIISTETIDTDRPPATNRTLTNGDEHARITSAHILFHRGVALK